VKNTTKGMILGKLAGFLVERERERERERDRDRERSTKLNNNIKEAVQRERKYNSLGPMLFI
jgi:hypothetical protein